MLGRRGRLVAVALVLGAAVGVVPHSARAATDLGGYELSASAPALELILDSGVVPVPAHPVIDATLPETAASLDSGLGHGLATLFWPGDLGGHAGSAVQQLGQLCTSLLPITLPNVPTECTPVPQALKDNAAALNDPVKAETFAPGGPADDAYTFTPPLPGVTMQSHADSTRVDSIAGFASFGAPGLGSLGSVTSHSVTTARGGNATGQATSELFDVTIAGGLVTIDHIQSTAKEATDGQRAIGNGDTVVSGMRIGGVPVSVDSTGLGIGSLSTMANKALGSLGLQISLSAPTVLTDGAKGSYAAPLLTITYRDDQNALEAAATALGQKLTTGSLQQLTGSLQPLAQGPQANVTVAFGGATVAVDGSPAFTSPSEAGGTGEPALPAVPSIASTSLGTSGSPAVESLTFSAAGPSVNRSERALPAAHPAGFLDPFGGVGWGLILVAVAAALALGYGLRRYALAVDAAGAERPAH